MDKSTLSTISDFISGADIIKVIVILAVASVLYFIGSRVISNLVKRGVQASGKHRDMREKDIEKRAKTLKGLFRMIWRVLVITGATFGIFSIFFDTAALAPLFASAGIVGVALGFGAQSLVQDFLSGLFIISENQYRVGDIVEIEGSSGTVERIGARSTVIRDFDGNVHYFPNGMVGHVINKTMGYSMARFSIGVHPSTDIDEVVVLINEMGEALAKEEKWKNKIIEAPSFVWVGEFTSTGVDLLISGKTQPSDQWSVVAEMRRRLLHEFEKRGIQLSINAAAITTTQPAAKRK